MDKFRTFLESIKNSGNSSLLNSIIKGYHTIIESPDKVILSGQNELRFRSLNAIPFIYVNDELYLDKELRGERHYDLLTSIAENLAKNNEKYNGWKRHEILYNEELIDEDGNNTTVGFHGRLWLGDNVMSFWKYPSKHEFKKIISDLNSHGLNINDDWKVEVYKRDNSDSIFGYSSTILIPISEYDGKFASDEYIQKELDKSRELHTMDPIQKQREKNKNPDRELPTKDVNKPNDMTMAEYNMLYRELTGD